MFSILSFVYFDFDSFSDMNQSKSVANVVSLDDDMTVEAYLKLKLKETIEVI
jgi:hypothetical protein